MKRAPYEVIAYAYFGRSCAPYRALRIDSRDARPRRALLRTARRIFGPNAILATGPVSTAVDRDGRAIYGPAGREVIQGGASFQVWRDGSIAGYVTLYNREANGRETVYRAGYVTPRAPRR